MKRARIFCSVALTLLATILLVWLAGPRKPAPRKETARRTAPEPPRTTEPDRREATPPEPEPAEEKENEDDKVPEGRKRRMGYSSVESRLPENGDPNELVRIMSEGVLNDTFDRFCAYLGEECGVDDARLVSVRTVLEGHREGLKSTVGRLLTVRVESDAELDERMSTIQRDLSLLLSAEEQARMRSEGWPLFVARGDDGLDCFGVSHKVTR